MKMKLNMLLPAILAMAVAPLHAETKSSPAVVVQVILTEKTDEYLGLLAQSNTRIESLTGLKQLRASPGPATSPARTRMASWS